MLQNDESPILGGSAGLGSAKLNDKKLSEIMFQINNVVDEIEEVDLAKKSNGYSAHYLDESGDEIAAIQNGGLVENLQYCLDFRDRKISSLIKISKNLVSEVQDSTGEASGLRD